MSDPFAFGTSLTKFKLQNRIVMWHYLISSRRYLLIKLNAFAKIRTIEIC